MAGPVLKNLKSEGSKAVYNSMAEYFLPFTGLQGHEMAEDVKGLLEKGEVNTALDTLERHRIRFKPQGLWLNEPEPSRSAIIPSQDMNSHQVYKAARKTIPYIDNVLTERLKSQSIVDSSLTQALFDDLKHSLSQDMISANDRLQGVLSKAGNLEALLKEALEDHQVDRVALYSSCIITLVVSVICVILIGLMWCHVVSKVNDLIDVMSRCGEREPLTQSNSNHPLHTTSFSFAVQSS